MKLYFKILSVMTVGILLCALTFLDLDLTCPVDGHKFKFSKATSGYIQSQRLDMRDLGNVASPSPIPMCPKCKAILYKPSKETYSVSETKVLRKIVHSDSYKKLASQIMPYERLAIIFNEIDREPEIIAMNYLRASWQAESINESEDEIKRLLTTSLKYLDLYLEKSSKNDSNYMTYEFLKGELLRRLAKFKEAENYFENLSKDSRYINSMFKDMVDKELKLISNNDARPH